MVQFNYIKIKDYKSIKEAYLEFTSGLWSIQGVNNDSSFKSNGAGKSTVLEALQQCLFNKNVKGITIEDTFNRITKKGYCITTEFVKDGSVYLVENDRIKGTLTVIKDSVDISEKTIPLNVRLIQDIIGFDFNTFCSLTYVSHNNIVQMLESFSSSNLMKVLLDFDSISQFEGVVKGELAKSKEILSFKLAENSGLEESLKLLNSSEKVDLVPLYNYKSTLDTNYKRLKSVYEEEVQAITEKIRSYNVLMSMYNTTIDKSKDILMNAPCCLCGEVPRRSLSAIIDARIDLKGNRKLKRLLIPQIDVLKKELDTLYDNITISNEKYFQDSQFVNTQISLAEYKNELFESNKDKLVGISSKIEQNKLDMSAEYFNQDLYDTVLKTIKSGKLHKGLLDNFTKVLNICIDDYIKYMNIDYLNIKSKATKTNIDFVLYDNRTQQFIEINTLSGGELTRIRIVILVSMLKTVSTLTKANTNILILDEALDTLDKSASTDLARLFKAVIQADNKFIALVSHGDQLKDIDFYGTITAVKTDGLTSIIQDS